MASALGLLVYLSSSAATYWLLTHPPTGKTIRALQSCCS